jgi:hypothetical protein
MTQHSEAGLVSQHRVRPPPYAPVEMLDTLGMLSGAER